MSKARAIIQGPYFRPDIFFSALGVIAFIISIFVERKIPAVLGVFFIIKGAFGILNAKFPNNAKLKIIEKVSFVITIGLFFMVAIGLYFITSRNFTF